MTAELAEAAGHLVAVLAIRETSRAAAAADPPRPGVVRAPAVVELLEDVRHADPVVVAHAAVELLEAVLDDVSRIYAVDRPTTLARLGVLAATRVGR